MAKPDKINMQQIFDDIANGLSIKKACDNQRVSKQTFYDKLEQHPELKDDEVYEIYCLSCPKTNIPMYIGKSKNSKKRFAQHIYCAKRKRTPLYLWIKGLLKEGTKPKLSVLYKTKNWVKDEKKEIKSYREKYPNLLNIAEGGNEPFCPKEVRQENGRKNAYKVHHTDPLIKEIWSLKKELCLYLKNDWLKQETKGRLFKIAMEAPKTFGVFLKYER